VIVEDPTTPKALPCEIMAFKNFTDQRRGNDSHKNIHADFVEPGIKDDGKYYKDVLLRQQLLLSISTMSSGLFTLQQDDAAAAT